MPKRRNFEGLLSLAVSQRDDAARRVAECADAIRSLDRQLHEIESRNAEMDSLRKRASLGEIRMEMLRTAESIQAALASEQARIVEEKKAELQRLEQLHEVLLRCQQAAKSLEKLHERQLLQERMETEKREIAALEDWTQQVFPRSIPS